MGELTFRSEGWVATEVAGHLAVLAHPHFVSHAVSLLLPLVTLLVAVYVLAHTW